MTNKIIRIEWLHDIADGTFNFSALVEDVDGDMIVREIACKTTLVSPLDSYFIVALGDYMDSREAKVEAEERAKKKAELDESSLRSLPT